MENAADENPYKSPEFANTAVRQVPEEMLKSDKTIRVALSWAAVETLFFVLWDMGELTWLWVATLVAWGAAIIIILLRYHFGRSRLISRWDVNIIKFGPWPILVLIYIYSIWLAAHHH